MRDRSGFIGALRESHKKKKSVQRDRHVDLEAVFSVHKNSNVLFTKPIMPIVVVRQETSMNPTKIMVQKRVLQGSAHT